jgi:hypothetical protein
VHNYIQPHEYNLRKAGKAWLMRIIKQEEMRKVSFYVDELHPRDVPGLLRRVVDTIGGPRQREGRLLVACGIKSWSDIGEEKRANVGPRSRTIITIQGKARFVEKVTGILLDEKVRRRIPRRKRTTLIYPAGGNMWAR